MIPRLLATACLLCAVTSADAAPSTPPHPGASPAETQPEGPSALPLHAGSYLLERFETLDDPASDPAPAEVATAAEIESLRDDAFAQMGQAMVQGAATALGSMLDQVLGDVEAQLKSAAASGWLQIEPAARRAVVHTPDMPQGRPARFTDDATRLIADDDAGMVMHVEIPDPDRLVMTLHAFNTHRLTWRRADEGDPALQRARELVAAAPAVEAARAEAARQAVAELAEGDVTLAVRHPLRGLPASMALPADAVVEGDAQRYLVRAPELRMRIIGIEGDDAAAQVEALEAGFGADITDGVTLDDGIRIRQPYSDTAYVFAEHRRGRHTLVLLADVEPARVADVVAMWRSLDAPVEAPVLLQMPDATAAQATPDAQAFDEALQRALGHLLDPARFLVARAMTPDDDRATLGTRITLAGDDRTQPRVSAELVAGSADDALARFADHPLDARTGIDWHRAGCRAVAVLPVQFDPGDHVYALVLRDASTGSLARCATSAARLREHTTRPALRAHLPEALHAGFSAFERVARITDGRLRVEGDQGMGVLAADGRVLVPPVHTRVSTRSGLPGFVVHDADAPRYLAEDGRVLIDTPFDAIHARGAAIQVTRDGKRAAFSLEGRPLTGFDYDSIAAFAENRLLQLRQGHTRAVLDPHSGRMLLPLEAGVTRLWAVGTQPRFLSASPDGHALHDFDGHRLIDGAADIRRMGTWMLAVQVQPEGDYRFVDFDGRPLSDTTWQAVHYNAQRQLIVATDHQGRRRLLGPDLSPLSPAGLHVVFLPGDDGYVVVADDATPRRMGMATPGGSLVLPLAYREVFTMREGLIVAQTFDGEWGAWDAAGQPLIDAEWEALTQSFGGHLFARRDGRWRVVDQTGAGQDARRWSQLGLHVRNAGGAPPFATARIQGGAHHGRWEVLDMHGTRTVDGTFDTVETLSDSVRLHRGGEVVRHPAQ